MEPIIWLGILIVLIIIEIITLGLSTIWFAGGAIVSFIAALLGADVVIQVILFLVVSIILLLFTRPVAVKYLNHNRTRTNIDSLIGKQAVVIEEIENLKGLGKVQVNGLEWTARTSEDYQNIEKDSIVNIVRVDGVKLIVERRGEGL